MLKLLFLLCSCLSAVTVHLSAIIPALKQSGCVSPTHNLCGLCACVCVNTVHKKCGTVLSSWLLILSDCCWLLAGAQEYMKLSDVYKMYGSSGSSENSKPASHGRSFAIDAALAGSREVPSLPVCLFCLTLCSPPSVCLSILPFSCHVAPSAGLLLIKLLALLSAFGVSMLYSLLCSRKAVFT